MHVHITEKGYGTTSIGGWGEDGDEASVPAELKEMSRRLLGSAIAEARRTKRPTRGVFTVEYCNDYSFFDCYRWHLANLRAYNMAHRA